MTWAELERALDLPPRAASASDADPAVTGIAYDSRRVNRGDVFVALKGLKADGLSFARHAIERGAVAVVSEQAAPQDVHVQWATVPDARRALAALADSFYRHPSGSMQVI